MDLTQLVITLVSVVGIVLVGAMAVVPSVMDARAGGDAPRPAAPAPTPRARHRRPRHRPVDLAV